MNKQQDKCIENRESLIAVETIEAVKAVNLNEGLQHRNCR